MKLKVSYLLPLLIFSIAGFAKADDGDDTYNGQSTRTEGGYCIECANANPTNFLNKQANDIRNIRNTIVTESPGTEAAKIINQMNWAGTCDNFASDSEYGPYGRQIVDEFSTQKYETLINGSADLKMECPGYDAMDRESKIELWVTIFAGMAFNESSCQENPEKHRGPHGFLSGIFQLHKGMEDKYSKTCIKNAGATVENSIPCTMAMLRNQLDDAKIVNGKPDEGKLFAKHSYWEVLRPQAKIKKADKIKKAVKLFPKCSSLKAS